MLFWVRVVCVRCLLGGVSVCIAGIVYFMFLALGEFRQSINCEFYVLEHGMPDHSVLHAREDIVFP